MKKYNLLLINLFFIIVLSLNSSFAFASNTVNIQINGKDVNFTQNTGFPYVDENNRTMVPLRVTMQTAGADVGYDKYSKVAVVSTKTDRVEIPIDKNILYVNNLKVQNDTYSVVKNGITYLPIRAVLQASGFVVEWDATSKTVYAFSKPSSDMPAKDYKSGSLNSSVYPLPPTKETQNRDFDLLSGHYTVGTDIPRGTYDITAVSGFGNVISENVNTILMSEDYQQNVIFTERKPTSCKNVTLSQGDILTLNGLTANLKSEDATTDKLTPRNQSITEPYEITAGTWQVGPHIKEGIYDIRAINGFGNVISSNSVLDGGINTILSSSGYTYNGYTYGREYKNVNLKKGTTLLLKDVDIILIPSF